MISQSLIERDFHEILHKFQTLDDGAEVASEEDDDQLQMEPQGKDLDEEDNTDAAESRDADVQIENGATDFEESEEKKREVNIPAKYHEIAVVEEFLDDDADEGGQLKNGQTLKQREGGEENPTEETGETVASENKIESTEDVAKMAEDKKKELEKHEGGVIKEIDECEDKNEEEDEREDDDKEKGGKESGIKEEDKGKEDKGKEEEGNEDDVEEEKEDEDEGKVYKSGWSSPLGDLAHLMLKNQEEMERAVDRTEMRLVEEKSKQEKKKEKVSMQQVIRAFSAVRNLKKIFR